jgi:hypothetical protein
MTAEMVAGLSKWRREAEPLLLRVGSVVEKGTATGFYKNISVSCERFLSEYFGFSFASTI